MLNSYITALSSSIITQLLLQRETQSSRYWTGQGQDIDTE